MSETENWVEFDMAGETLEDLTAIAAMTGVSESDAVNRAVAAYRRLCDERARGGHVLLKSLDGRVRVVTGF